jgi:hypothetical protein
MGTLMVLPEVDVSGLEHSPYDMEADRIPYPDPHRPVGHHVTRKVSLVQTYGQCHALVGAMQGVGNRELCTGELHRSTAVTRSTTQVNVAQRDERVTFLSVDDGRVVPCEAWGDLSTRYIAATHIFQ